jgi:2Fe-2S ferredoxin
VVTIVFVSPGGRATVVDVAPGTSVMMAAITNGIDGIEAECGGAMACGTCHVYVEPADLARLEPAGEGEDAMLDMTTAPRKSCSRLGCQIELGAALNGITVHIPPSQD